MIGERIRLAREFCGLTQQELADGAGISQPALSQIEVGQVREPVRQTMEAISDATGFPLSYFDLGPLPDLPEGNYRKLARGTVRASKQVRAQTRHIVEIVQRGERSLRLPPVRIAPVSELSGPDEIESLVVTVRDTLGVGERDPIPNVIRAVERSGVVVARLPGEVEAYDSFSAWPELGLGEGRPVIVLTGEHPGDRERFTVAHELGHLVLHSIRRGIEHDQAEKEANQFAGALLLAPQAATEAMQPPVTLRVLMNVKATFGISMQAAAKRALSLNLISLSQGQSLFRQLSQRGWKVDEPVSVDREQPVLLPKIIDALTGTGSELQRAQRAYTPVFAFHALTSAALDLRCS